MSGSDSLWEPKHIPRVVDLFDVLQALEICVEVHGIGSVGVTGSLQLHHLIVVDACTQVEASEGHCAIRDIMVVPYLPGERIKGVLAQLEIFVIDIDAL